MRAAEQLFARDGYERVNSNQIARDAGVGVGTFYRHFEDKPALVDALMLQAWEEIGRAMPGPEVEQPLEVAEAATRAAVGYAEAHPERFRAAFARGRRSKVSLSLRPVERRFRQLAEQGLVSPELEPAVAARAWWAMISGTLLWWLEDRDRADAESLIATLQRLHPLAVLASARVIPS